MFISFFANRIAFQCERVITGYELLIDFSKIKLMISSKVCIVSQCNNVHSIVDIIFSMVELLASISVFRIDW